MMSSMIAYEIAAGTNCAYHTTNGYFNDFFINSAKAIYAEEPYKAPWIIAPLYYHFFLDLFYNQYDGNLEIIKNKAIATVIKLSSLFGLSPKDRILMNKEKK